MKQRLGYRLRTCQRRRQRSQRTTRHAGLGGRPRPGQGRLARAPDDAVPTSHYSRALPTHGWPTDRSAQHQHQHRRLSSRSCPSHAFTHASCSCLRRRPSHPVCASLPLSPSSQPIPSQPSLCLPSPLCPLSQPSLPSSPHPCLARRPPALSHPPQHRHPHPSWPSPLAKSGEARVAIGASAGASAGRLLWSPRVDFGARRGMRG